MGPRPRTPRSGAPDAFDKAIDACALLRGLDGKARTRLRRGMQRRDTVAGEVLAPDDEPLHSLVLVVRGELELRRRGVELRAPVVTTIGAGGLVGGGVGPSARRIGLVAHGPARVAVASAATLRRLCRDDDAVAAAVAGLRLRSRAGPTVIAGMRRSVVLGRATPAELQGLVDTAALVRVDALGSMSAALAAPVSGLVVVLSGEIFVRGGRAGVTTAVLGPGDLIGDLELVSGRPLPQDLVAGSRGATLLVVGEETLLSALRLRPAMRRAVLATPYGAPDQRRRLQGRLNGRQGRAEVVALAGPLPSPGLSTLTGWLARSLRRQFSDRVALVCPGQKTRASMGPDKILAVELPATSSPLTHPRLSQALREADLVLLAAAGDARGWQQHADRVVHLWTGGDRPTQARAGCCALLPLAQPAATPLLGDTRLPRALLTAPAGSDPPRDLQRAVDAWARALTDRRVGLALGGGGALAYGHVLLLQELVARGLPVDVLTGVSGGAVVAAAFAVHGPAGLDQLVALGPRFARAQRHAWLHTGRVEGVLRELVGDARLEALPRTFVPVATDIDRGVQIHLELGPVARAVLASGAFPGTFSPVHLRAEGRTRRLVDGGVVNLVPDDAARLAGARLVLASNVVSTPRPRPPHPGRTPGRLWARVSPRLRLDDVLRAANQLLHAPVDFESRHADVRLRAAPAPYSPADWGRGAEILAWHRDDDDAHARISSAADSLEGAMRGLRHKRVSRRHLLPEGHSIGVTVQHSEDAAD